jgi:predicted TIM-barrel fold metal-dependent hydrolase
MTETTAAGLEKAVQAANGYRLYDADNHYYETYDSFTRYLEPEFSRAAIHVVPQGNGRNRVMVGDTPLRSNPAHPQDFVHAPGSLYKMFASGSANDAELVHARMRGSDNPTFVDRESRLAFMDAEGISGAVIYPSLGVMVEQQLAHDPQATFANMRAFNRWLEEDWGYGQDGRIISVPMLSLLDIDLATAELDRVLAKGARAIHLRPGPVDGRSPADPHFDPFWARLNEAKVPLAMHASFGNYCATFSVLWGEEPDPTYADITPFQSLTCQGARIIMDTLSALVLHGLFERFPDLYVMSIESGARWLPGLLHDLDHAALNARRSRLAPKLSALPAEILRQHLYISPHPEDDPMELARAFPADRIMFGSDYPHAEGLDHPMDYLGKLNAFDDEARRGIIGRNVARLVGTW